LKLRIKFFTGLFLLNVPAVVNAQDPRLVDRLDSTVLPLVMRVVEEARSGGIPTEPLIDKALEGASKRAGGRMIVRAVRNLFNFLQEADSILGPDASDADVVVAAEAMRAGAAEEVIVEMNRLTSDNSMVVPLGVLTDLVGMGVPSEMAGQAVLKLAADKSSDRDFLDLRTSIRNDIRAGTPPLVAASVRSGVPSAVPPPTFAPAPPSVAAPVREPL